MSRLRSTGRRGFTLIELLTVIAIIIILAALIMTAVFSTQESGRIAHCRNNLNQLHKLIYLYTTTYGNYLPAFWHERWIGELGLAGCGSWGRWPPGNLPQDKPVEGGTYDGYMCPQVWNNLSIGGTTPFGGFPVRSGAPFLVCKSDVSNFRCDQGCITSYLGLAKYGWWHRAGAGGSIETANKPKFEYRQLQEFDSTSKRIMLMECEPGTWQTGGCGCRWHAYRHPVFILERHYGGGNIIFFDGHIELAKGKKRYIRYWEPDFDQVDPDW